MPIDYSNTSIITYLKILLKFFWVHKFHTRAWKYYPRKGND